MIKKIFIRLKHSTFFKNILIVMTGTVVAQAIGFLLSPIISRLFSPSDFGVFGSFYSVLGIITAGVTLQYSQAIILPKEKENAINLFFVSCFCTFFVSCILLALCLIFPAYLNGLMKTEGGLFLTLLVAAAIVAGLNQSFQAWCVRIKAFKQTSTSQVVRSVASNSTQIGFGLIKGGGAGLVVSSVLADIVASINLLRVLIPDILAYRTAIRWDRMKKLAWEYHDFPMYSASQNVINAVSTGLPVLLLTHFFGIAVAGAYAFGVRILMAPMGFVLTALRQVLLQKAAETQHQGGNLSSLYIKVTAGLFGIAFLPVLVIFIWAPQIFSWIFGTQWLTAGLFARGLIIWMLFVFCNLPAVLFARLIRIQRTVFFYDLVLLAVRVSILVIGGLYLSALYCVMLFSVVGAVMNLCLILIVGFAIVKKKGTGPEIGFIQD